jgi:hypothetical protein
VVRVRLFGNRALGWLDAVELWGASVEVFVLGGGNVKHLIDQIYPEVYVAPLPQAVRMPPYGDWDGLLLGTLGEEEDAQNFKQLLKAWRPWLVLIVVHHSVSRRRFNNWINHDVVGYNFVLHQQCCHKASGGVTNSMWRLAIFTRTNKAEEFDFNTQRMTASLYPRHLQTTLDDTVGGQLGASLPDIGSDKQQLLQGMPCGYMDKGQPIYDGAGIGPDLSVLSKEERCGLWVLAVSVFSKEIGCSGRLHC